MLYLIALVLLAGFVAVTLVDRRRRHGRSAVATQRVDPDPPADPDPEPDAWPPTR